MRKDQMVIKAICGLILFMFLAETIFSQNKHVVCCPIKFCQGIWVPPASSQDNYYKINDTVNKKIDLIFELWFDDSIRITLNEKKYMKKNKIIFYLISS